MLHKPDLCHIIVKSHSGRYLLLEADRYQKFYLIFNAPVGYEHLIGKKIQSKRGNVLYRTRQYRKACEWIRRRELEKCTD